MSTEPQAPSVLSMEEAAQRLRDAKQALHRAQQAHAQAMQAYADAEGRHSGGLALAQLALRGNAVAMRELDEQVRALHPGIVGYLPVPGPNDDVGWFHRDMKDLGLRIDLPADVDEEFLAGLAEALRLFVHRYKPQISHQQARSGRQGFAYAETRAGRLLYGVRRQRPAYLVHAESLFGDDDPRPDENYWSLEEALTALPPLVFLAALSGRRNFDFQ